MTTALETGRSGVPCSALLPTGFVTKILNFQLLSFLAYDISRLMSTMILDSLKGQFKMSASNLPTDKGKVKHTWKGPKQGAEQSHRSCGFPRTHRAATNQNPLEKQKDRKQCILNGKETIPEETKGLILKCSMGSRLSQSPTWGQGGGGGDRDTRNRNTQSWSPFGLG